MTDSERCVVNNVRTENLEAVERALESYIKGFKTVEEAADSLGVSRVFLWMVRNRKKLVSETILQKLGFTRTIETVVTYVKE